MLFIFNNGRHKAVSYMNNLSAHH